MIVTSGDVKQIRAIFHKESIEIFRDKKIILFSLLIPIVIYPIVFWGIAKLSAMQDEKLASQGISIGLLQQYTIFPDTWNIENMTCRTRVVRDPIDGLKNGCQLVFDFSETEMETLAVRLFFDGSDDTSVKVMNKVKKWLEEHQASIFGSYIKLHYQGVEISSEMMVETKDIGSISARSGHHLAKVLPFILVIMLVGGCSSAAVDLIAGEKERGCFETLLVSPVARKNVIFGKFSIVFIMGMISVLLSLAGLMVSLKLGMIRILSSTGSEFKLNMFQIGSIGLCIIPLAFLFSAIILYISVRAKTFQEGQLMLFPFTLAVLVPTVAGILPDMASAPFIFLVPIANIVVSMKELLEGSANIVPFAVANFVNLGYAGAALALTVRHLKREGTFIKASSDVFSGAFRPDPVKQGIFFFSITWILFYFIATALQSWNLPWGLFLTLWVLLPGLTFFYMKRTSLPIIETMRLKHVSWTVYPSVVFFSIGMYFLVLFLNSWLTYLLPVPERITKGFYDLFFNSEMTVFQKVFLLCISPAINEELMFRGALMGGFSLRLKPISAIVLSGALFGILHFDIYRLFPTMLLGFAFGYIVYKTGSLFPGMLAHFTNNLTALYLAPAFRLDQLSPPWYGFALPIVILGIRMISATSRR